MSEAHPRERRTGLACYASESAGTGGVLRERPEEFRVREREAFAAEPPDSDPADYPYLVVRATLREWETGAFARRIADRLGASQKRVDWAGTKDRNAVTTQLFTLRDIDPAELPAVEGADIEVVGRAGRAIEFGDLAGNEFDVLARDVTAPERADAVTAELAALAPPDAGPADDGDRVVGVPNFFGPQRFGSHRRVTHEVGLAIVRQEWETAAMSYLGQTGEREPPGTRRAREYVAETRDWTGALERFPRRLGYERTVLGELAGESDPTPEAFREALAALPWHLTRLFVNAAQSYAFNRIVSERLERGLPLAAPVAGDVVCFASEQAGLAVPEPDRTQRVTEDRVGAVARHCARGRAFVTAPLVGTETELGAGEPGDIERGVLGDLGLEPADFALPEPFGSSGTRRSVLLVAAPTVSPDRDDLRFGFALPKGSYATVLLREYLKVDPADL